MVGGWSLVGGWDKTGGSRSELTNGNKPPPSKMWVHSMASHLFTIKHHTDIIRAQTQTRWTIFY